jgi:DNA-binding CsgD family transcriptional regulator
MDAERRGLVVTTMLPRVTSLSRGLRARWQLVAVHLAAAYRLRSRLAVAAPASCVVDANGRVVHASGEATARAARERLRAAVIARDRARTRKHRSKPDEALALWAGLAAGRWSLVDRFERDGRRFIVAWRNDTDPKGPLALSRRERQVVSHLLQGDSLKVAAYALGIAPSTASMAASQARLKLGVRTLSDVARLVANEDAAPASAPP